MNLTHEQYVRLELELEAIFSELAQGLDSDSVTAVRWNIDHGEIEMAFEGLCLELITLSRRPNRDLCERLRSLGIELGLNEESVYDTDFWKHFIDFIEGEK